MLTPRMRRRRQLQRYGQLAIGQRVRYARLVMPPTTLASFWNNQDEPVSIDQRAEIVDIRESESGALVTLRLEEGGGYTRNFHYWGADVGGFGMLHVEREAPEQRTLVRDIA